MNFEIVSLPAMVVVGSELRTTWMNKECYSAIPEFWQEQITNNRIQAIPDTDYSEAILGLYTNYSSDFSLTSGYYSLIIGCCVTGTENVPSDMVIARIAESKYAVFTAHGPFDQSLGKVWLEEIWNNTDLDRTFTYDFEWYDAQSTNDENSIVKIYIAIKGF
jgi:predicted transcriptional regulator YdeE